MYRMGVGYQNNNLFNRDQAATLNYVTSPDHISDIRQFSASYRMPIYSLGDSIDLIAAHSNSNVIGTASGLVGGGSLTVVNGNTYSVHYNHYLPRQGEYTSKFIGGLDYRINNCSEGSFASAGCASGGSLTVHPLSVTYNGTLTKASSLTDYSVSVLHNLSGGHLGGQGDFDNVFVASNYAKNANAGYTLMRFNGSVAGALTQDWQYRVVGNVQYTQDVMPPSDGIGLVGASAVRGFIEREINTDKGYVLNLELYTPELAPQIKLQNGSFRLLGFVDRAYGGWNNNVIYPTSTSAASAGIGFRLVYGKNFTAKLDLAQVTELSGPEIANLSTKSGDRRGVLSVLASW
jgi:hemolysin activation/secretion protein